MSRFRRWPQRVISRGLDILFLPMSLARGRHWALRMLAILVYIPWFFATAFPLILLVILPFGLIELFIELGEPDS